MTDKKTVTQPAASADTDSALKKEETVKGAGAKPARSTLDSDQKDKRKVKRENENRLLKAYLYIQSAKDKLEKTTEFLKRENAGFKAQTQRTASGKRAAWPLRPITGRLRKTTLSLNSRLKTNALKRNSLRTI